jgi:antitoxin Phd
MKRVWQLQEAKNKLSEVVDNALKGEPQIISRRGTETAVILSVSDYKKLVLDRKKLSDFFHDSPLSGVEGLDLMRDKSGLRIDTQL